MLEGFTDAWVHGKVKQGSLLSAASSTAGCAHAADLDDGGSLHCAVAIALDEKVTAAVDKIRVFVTMALSAAAVVKQQGLAEVSFCSLIASVKQQDNKLKV